MIKHIIGTLAFLLLFAGCGKFFRYILIDDTASYTRITFHEMYEQDNIDVLFVGSSHCYRSFIPELLDEKMKANTFNAGSSSQQLDGSYMIIKEAAKYNDIEHIYLELYFDMAFQEYKNRSDLTNVYIISDYLKPSWDKLQYLLNASSKEYYIYSFIPARRNWEKFFDADYVKNIVKKKQSKDYKDYEGSYISGGVEAYGGKGYVAHKQIVEDWNYFSNKNSKYIWNGIEPDNISEDWLDLLEDIIQFCDQKGIELTLISAPMSNYFVVGVQNYDSYVELVRNLITDTDVDYYDFNLCREEYFPNTSTLFNDIDHVNHYGAEKFSQLFADFVNGEISEETLFYDTYEEKVRNMAPTVFGISYQGARNDEGELIRNCKIVSTCNDNMEYEIILMPEDGEESRVLQEFSDNIFFTIASEEHGTCMIRYRLNDRQEEIWTTNISY